MAIEPFRPLELMKDANITKSEFKDFIGVWENFVPRPLCKEVIEYSETYLSLGSYVRPEKTVTNSTLVSNSEDYYGGSLNRKDIVYILDYSNRDMAYKINTCLTSCIKHYISEYSSLALTSLMSTDIKVQKTPPGGGYHLWHYENSDMAHAMRDVVWMIYLNDMPDGEAETEFLYQKRRIKPSAGTVVMWPAGYTHTHKGNTVLTQDKYILTGWYIKSK